MKRILLLLLSMVILLSVTGCSDGENKDVTNSEHADTNENVEQSVRPIAGNIDSIVSYVTENGCIAVISKDGEGGYYDGNPDAYDPYYHEEKDWIEYSYISLTNCGDFQVYEEKGEYADDNYNVHEFTKRDIYYRETLIEGMFYPPSEYRCFYYAEPYLICVKQHSSSTDQYWFEIYNDGSEFWSEWVSTTEIDNLTEVCETNLIIPEGASDAHQEVYSQSIEE